MLHDPSGRLAARPASQQRVPAPKRPTQPIPVEVRQYIAEQHACVRSLLPADL